MSGWGLLRADDKIPTLPERLKTSGFNPEVVAPGMWQVTLDKNNWKVHLLIWERDRITRLECKFAKIVEPDAVSATAWRRLLALNESLAPAHFAFDEREKRLYLYRPLSPTESHGEALKKSITDFDELVRGTVNVWSHPDFQPPERIQVKPQEVDFDAEFDKKIRGVWQMRRCQLENKPFDALADKVVRMQFGPNAVTTNDLAPMLSDGEHRRQCDPDRPTTHLRIRERGTDRLVVCEYRIEGDRLTLKFPLDGWQVPVRKYITDRELMFTMELLREKKP